MNLKKWLLFAGISQRELARRLGYASNGPFDKIIKGIAYVPPSQIHEWADALRLEPQDRKRWVSECCDAGIPDWLNKQMRQLETNERVLTTLVETLIALAASGTPIKRPSRA